MLHVSYDKGEVLKTWLNTKIEKRKELLTFRESNLIAIVNCINASLVLTANGIKGNFENLESIDTYWSEPMHMQIKPSFVKGLKLVNVLQEKYSQFLIGKKCLFLDQNEFAKFFDGEIDNWESFQFAICKLIEQAFLIAHYYKLKELSDKAAVEILELDLIESKKKKKNKGKKEKNICEEPWCDVESFFVEISSDKSTDIDDKEIFDTIWFDINAIGGRSYAIRKYYASVSLDWDYEVNQIINQAYFESHPFEYLSTYPVVKYYDYSANYFLHNN